VIEGSKADEVELPDYVQFFATGTITVGQFHCSECGYGVSVRRSLPLCPMCGGTSWEANRTRLVG